MHESVACAGCGLRNPAPHVTVLDDRGSTIYCRLCAIGVLTGDYNTWIVLPSAYDTLTRKDQP